jgi:beta-1,2-rhamnosyltransferase WsaF-like protein
LSVSLYKRWTNAPGPERERFEACFDRAFYAERVAEDTGLALSEEDPLAQYFHGPEYGAVSPNPLFDETWYRSANRDVHRAVSSGATYSGFMHFMKSGLAEGRAPNGFMAAMMPLGTPPLPIERSEFDAATYLRQRPEARTFIKHFPIVDAWTFYATFGHRMGHAPAFHEEGVVRDSPAGRLLRARFDPVHYAATYLNGTEDAGADPFEHYLSRGAEAGNHPNAWFDEAWYIAYYADARQAVQAGQYLSGFHHYLVVGEGQSRLPSFDLTRALEGRLPGVTDPSLLRRTAELEKRVRAIHPEHRESATPRVWFALNTLNPDIAFGGYQAAFEMMKAVVRSGREIGVIVTEDARSDKEYFAYRKSDPELVAAVMASPLLNHRAKQESLAPHPADQFVVYSVWDLWTTRELVARTGRKPYLVAQEYEPIFYEYASHRAMAEAGYDLPHIPVFNSELLKAYFEANRFGVFGRTAPVMRGQDYHVFEHVPARLRAGGKTASGSKDHRTLAFYARPEMHASRNLFEIGLTALRKACQAGVFDDRWRFVGLGSLQEATRLSLGGGHELELVQKMPLAEYEAFVTDIDVGLSLMYAPHPGLVHFEFAAAGAVVVTNTFDNRPADVLTAMSKNLIPCAPTIDAVAAGLATAALRCEDFKERRKNRLLLPEITWPEVFSPTFLDEVFGPGPGAVRGERPDSA